MKLYSILRLVKYTKLLFLFIVLAVTFYWCVLREYVAPIKNNTKDNVVLEHQKKVYLISDINYSIGGEDKSSWIVDQDNGTIWHAYYIKEENELVYHLNLVGTLKIENDLK